MTVAVDPARLRAFSHALKGFSRLVDHETAQLRQQLFRLGSSWRDQEFERFSAELDKSVEHLKRLKAEMDNLAPSLERDAAAAEAIHGRNR